MRDIRPEAASKRWRNDEEMNKILSSESKAEINFKTACAFNFWNNWVTLHPVLGSLGTSGQLLLSNCLSFAPRVLNSTLLSDVVRDKSFPRKVSSSFSLWSSPHISLLWMTWSTFLNVLGKSYLLMNTRHFGAYTITSSLFLDAMASLATWHDCQSHWFKSL